jgi:hypothetical protein
MAPESPATKPFGGEDWLSALRTHGWQQGAILPAPLRDGVVGLHNGSAIRDRDVLLVVSQSCDILHGSLEAEPLVEVIGARRVDSPDPLSINRRNPRKLHLILSSRGSAVIEVLSHDRGTLARERLSEAAPDGVLEPAALEDLIAWLARRYSRPAFPDAFMERLGNVRRRLERLVRSFSDEIVGVYVALSDWGELSDDVAYEIVLLLVVDSNHWYEGPNERNRLDNELHARLVQILNAAPGIRVVQHQLLPEDMVRISHLNRLTSLDIEP